MRWAVHGRRILAALDQWAEHWIGYAHPPAHREVAEAEWEPDAPETYCPRCGDTLGPGESTSTGCGSCRNRSIPLEGVIRLGRYGSPLARWVQQIKFQARSDLADVLGRMLADRIRERESIDLNRTILVPMPMPWQRRLYRGIDHARVLAEAVARHDGLPVVPMLTRTNGPPQVTLARSQRAVNARKSLRQKQRWGGWPIRGLDVVLVDDVATTRSSLHAAARLLRPGRPRRIVAAVLAVTDHPDRRPTEPDGPAASDASKSDGAFSEEG